MSKQEPSRVDVWWAPTTLDDSQRARALPFLLEDEQKQHQRFMFDHNRDEYLVTRVLCRTMLAALTGIAPMDLTFERTAHGRPIIAAPQALRHFRFNLTNTTGLVACAVSSSSEVGIDAEWRLRKSTTVSIADRFFSAFEVAALMREPTEAQHERFFDYWTLKEAYIKARGLGLHIPLDKFSFDLSDDKIVLHCERELNDEGARWWFSQLRPTAEHTLSLCVERGAFEPPIVHWRETDMGTLL